MGRRHGVDRQQDRHLARRQVGAVAADAGGKRIAPQRQRIILVEKDGHSGSVRYAAGSSVAESSPRRITALVPPRPVPSGLDGAPRGTDKDIGIQGEQT